MYVLLDTSTATCKVSIMLDGQSYQYSWDANRDMARGLLKFITDCLAKHNATVRDVAGWGVMRGPGSFTGLRIGITTINTLGEFLQVPIIGESGDAWEEKALVRLQRSETDTLIVPDYGRPARITAPRK